MSLPRAKIHGTVSQLVCADCGASDPTWASLNRGVLICGECCSVHRSLGRHISQIRSLKRGAWHSSQLALIHTLYNNGANNIWEHLLLDPQGGSKGARRKPGPRDPVYPSKADFIRAKYGNLSFALRPNKDEGPLNLNDLNRQLWSCVRTGHVETTLRLLALGANPNYFDAEKGTSPLHVAGKEGQSLQVELLTIYGGDPAQPDFSGQSPADVARLEGHTDLAERLLDLQFETTDRLTLYLCGRKPEHQSAQHFLIPEMATSELIPANSVKNAKRRLQMLSAPCFEKLIQDVYDEVDRRETDAAWLASMGAQEAALINERYIVPFLPVNPEFTSTRNQSRQKLAKYNAREFASLIIDVLSETKRRYCGEIQPSTPTNNTPLPLPSSKNEKNETKTPSPENGTRNGNAGQDYDSVASPVMNGKNGSASPDEDEARGSSAAKESTLVTLEDYLELKDQLADSETKVKELTDSSCEVLKQLRSLQDTVARLMQENVDLRKEVVGIQMSAHITNDNNPPNPPGAATGNKQDAAWPKGNKPQPATRMGMGMTATGGRRITPSASTSSVPGDSESGSESEPRKRNPSDRSFPFQMSVEISTATQKTSTSAQKEKDKTSTNGNEEGFPNNIVVKTEELTREIQRLLLDAQSGRSGRTQSFAGHAGKIQAVVDRMVLLVPPSYRTPRIERCLNGMVESSISLTIQCSKDVPPEQQEQFACQVIQSAYDVAKMAKHLMNLIQE